MEATPETIEQAPAAQPAVVDNRSEDLAGDLREFITFTIGDLEYGVDIIDVHEIKGWTAPTRVPNAPPYMTGVSNLRGEIVPNYDLRMKFGMGTTEPNRTHVVVLVKVQGRTVGVLVDSVSDILSVPETDINPAPEGTDFAAAAWLDGLVNANGRMVSLLNLDALFGDEDVPSEMTE